MSLLPLGARVLVAMLAIGGAAEARSLSVRYSSPEAGSTLDGRNAQYVIRFDGWVDHEASRLELIANGKVVESLVPVLDSEPDALAASAPMLPAGGYQLRWHAKSVPDGDFSDGVISFTVAR